MSDRRPIDHGRLSRERSGRDVEPPRQSQRLTHKWTQTQP